MVATLEVAGHFGRFHYSTDKDGSAVDWLSPHAREASHEFVDSCEDPIVGGLEVLHQLFPEKRSQLVFDRPHPDSAFLP